MKKITITSEQAVDFLVVALKEIIECYLHLASKVPGGTLTTEKRVETSLKLAMAIELVDSIDPEWKEKVKKQYSEFGFREKVH